MRELPEPLLTELGRVTWAAISLEDGVGWICWTVNRNDDDAAPISGRANDAVKALKRRPESVERDRVVAWLELARDVLNEQRNRILHARPLTVVGPNGQIGGPMLGVMPRAGKGGRPDRAYEERPMTVDHLHEAYCAVVDVESQWREIALMANRIRLPVG